MEFHEVDPGEEVNVGRVIGTAESKERTQPLLSQSGTLGCQLTAKYGQVIQSLRVQLVVDDREEDVDDKAVLVLWFLVKISHYERVNFTVLWIFDVNLNALNKLFIDSSNHCSIQVNLEVY